MQYPTEFCITGLDVSAVTMLPKTLSILPLTDQIPAFAW
jgi:hypothetical protein